jgi:hypothetical protein
MKRETYLDLGVCTGNLAHIGSLLGKLTGRSKHEHQGALAAVLAVLDVVEDRQGESQRLTRTRLGDTDNITISQDDGPALALDGSGLGELLGDGHEVVVEVQLGEGLDRAEATIVSLNSNVVLLVELHYFRACGV